MPRCVEAFVIVIVAALFAPTPARANGAFPDSQSILTPSDRPQEIVLVTNFGLISTADNGKTWLWSCEQDGNALGVLYQMTPLPRNRLLAVTNQNVGYSDDGSCGWHVGAGAIAGQSVTDAYLDPVSGTRLLAIAVANQIYSVYPSTDAGATFGPAIYEAAAGQTITGVEIAQSDGNVIYIALRSAAGAPLLGRSMDGGAHFTLNDLSADLGTGLLRIIAVDPEDPSRVLMRFLSANDESIALTIDGGMTASKPVTVNGDFNSYTRLQSGTILIGGVIEYSTKPGLYRSRDRGTTFEQVANPPAIRALSQRAGLVYAAADNFGDGYALGTSADEGTTWQALMTYADVKAINPCLKAACQTSCEAQVSVSLWTDDVCAADPAGSAGTAGTGGAGQGGHGGSTGSAGSGGTTGMGGTGGAGAAPPKHGGCAVAGGGSRVACLLTILMFSIAAVGRRRGDRRS